MIYLGTSEVQRKCQSGSSTSRKSGKNSSKKQSDAESGISSLHSQASNSTPENLTEENHCLSFLFSSLSKH
jgi:hypothetical protein